MFKYYDKFEDVSKAMEGNWLEMRLCNIGAGLVPLECCAN